MRTAVPRSLIKKKTIKVEYPKYNVNMFLSNNVPPRYEEFIQHIFFYYDFMKFNLNELRFCGLFNIKDCPALPMTDVRCKIYLKNKNFVIRNKKSRKKEYASIHQHTEKAPVRLTTDIFTRHHEFLVWTICLLKNSFYAQV